MLSRRAAHPSTSALRVPSAARARNSAQRPAAAAVHCTDVCCGLNFTTVGGRAAAGALDRLRGGVALVGSRHGPRPAAPSQPAVAGDSAATSAGTSAAGRLAARFCATSASQPATARVVSTSNSYRAVMSGSTSAASR